MTTAKKPAPRKTAARKAAPRKASPQPPADVDVDAEREAAAQQQLRDDAQRARENLVDFEAYRARARMRLGNTAEPQQIVPFVLGPAQGFDPPIVITMPEATRDQLAIQLDDTEMDHAYFLEKQLRLIEHVGLQNYLQSQVGSGSPE